jgi:hypothetical protein
LSSILKALKKIEEESPQSQPFPSLPQTIDAEKDVKKRPIKRLFDRRWMAVFIILLVVIIAAAIVFSQRKLIIAKIFPPETPQKKMETTGSTSNEPGVFKAKITSQPAKPATGSKKHVPRIKKTAKSATPDPKSKELQANAHSSKSSIARENTKVNSANRRPQPEASAKSQRSLKTKPPIKQAAISRKTIAGKKAASNKPARAIPKSTTTRTYARIKDPKLKLQALAWFQDASKRMVVINGRIVREGESVEGYSVTQIRQEDVVVNDGRKTWSLEFGLKP